MAHPNAPPEEPIKQGVEAAQPAQPAALPAEQAALRAEQPASEASLESKAVEPGEVLEIESDTIPVG
jgi:hypothetical protein